MFLLLLMGLGAASVRAQVRIGGNTAPSAAAVLDLNAGNDNVANTGTGGLVLPRVDLTSSTKQLTPGVVNQTGTMVYNVTTTLGRIGVYYWNGNAWVNASLPSTSPADSGKLLMSNGTTIALSPITVTRRNTGSFSINTSPSAATLYLIFGAMINLTIPAWSSNVYTMQGLGSNDFCTMQCSATQNAAIAYYNNTIEIFNQSGQAMAGSVYVRCFRSSI